MASGKAPTIVSDQSCPSANVTLCMLSFNKLMMSFNMTDERCQTAGVSISKLWSPAKSSPAKADV